MFFSLREGWLQQTESEIGELKWWAGCAHPGVVAEYLFINPAAECSHLFE
jgi:hypothetical protein